MSKSNATENDMLEFLFKQTAWSGIGTTLYIALHTGDPGEGGDQTTNEATYGSYARMGISRTGAGWTVTGNTSESAVEIIFPTCTSCSETITHASIGVNASSTSKILYKGALNSPLAVSTNIAPRFIASSIVVTED